MGNVFSSCCPKNPCERQDEGQRLLHDSVPSPQTSSKVLEGCPVSTDCTSPESSETPSPENEKVTNQLNADVDKAELVPSQATVLVETDVSATQVKSDDVGNNGHMYAESAVDSNTLLDQQEAAAGVVSQVLADATKIVSASGERGVITSLASQTLNVPVGGDGACDVLHEKAESEAASVRTLEGTHSHLSLIGIESQSASTPIETPTISNEKGESLITVSNSQAMGESGCAPIKNQAVASEKLENHETATAIKNLVAPVVSESQGVTENLESHISATVINSQASSTITDNKSVSAKNVSETPGCSVGTEAEDSLDKITETLEQVPAVLSNGSLTEAVSVSEKAKDVIVPQEPLFIPKPAMDANLLTQNSLAEENKRKGLNEASKGLCSSPETHVQTHGHLAQQGGPSGARDGESEVELEAISAVPDEEDKVTEGSQSHSSVVGHGVSIEGPLPKSDLELSSAPTDTSSSAQDNKEEKRADENSQLREKSCNGEDISVTTEKGHTEMRDSAADSGAQDVVGLTTVSSLENLLEVEGMTKQDGLDESMSDVPVIVGGELATSLQNERPGSALRLSPLESDINELNSEEDLYRAEEEIEEENEHEKNKPEMTVPGLEDRCSLEPPMAILMYSEIEWKGQTTRSAVIRKGYAVLSHSFGCLRRVRGDNYCALRATLYQALMNTTQLPDWLQQKSILLISEELEARYGVIKGWRFPDICKQMNGTENAVDLLKHYLGLLQKWWHEAATSSGLEGRMRVCDELFQGGVDEFGLMEALKLLMLARAVELHTAMQSGEDVPIFCWLLFARDTSSCPRTLVANHLSQIGFSGGLEQVEMFLLGYAVRHTIKAYRLYKADTEEFITHYPDDHIQDWPCLCLVTEDDRHYNVVVGDPAHSQEDLPEGLQ